LPIPDSYASTRRWAPLLPAHFHTFFHSLVFSNIPSQRYCTMWWNKIYFLHMLDSPARLVMTDG
jgi:hypothetical protein